jgi:hypothetical protein
MSIGTHVDISDQQHSLVFPLESNKTGLILPLPRSSIVIDLNIACINVPSIELTLKNLALHPSA